MSYSIVSKIRGDHQILMRVTACCAIEGIPEPDQFTASRAWQYAAQPRWAAAWASAEAGGAGRPEPKDVANTINAMTPEERASLIALLAGG